MADINQLIKIGKNHSYPIGKWDGFHEGTYYKGVFDKNGKFSGYIKGGLGSGVNYPNGYYVKKYIKYGYQEQESHFTTPYYYYAYHAIIEFI